MIAAGFTDELVIGLVLGFLVGLLAAPVLRSWLGWRESLHVSRETYRAAREADLITEMLELMDADDGSRGSRQEEDAGSHRRRSTYRDRWQPQR